MSAKSIFVILLIFIAVLWYILWGPSGCQLLEDTKYGDINEELVPWIKEKIDASWLEGNPNASSIEVEKVRILKLTLPDSKLLDEAQVNIKGYYLSPQSDKKVKFDIIQKILVNRKDQPTSFRLP